MPDKGIKSSSLNFLGSALVSKKYMQRPFDTESVEDLKIRKHFYYPGLIGQFDPDSPQELSKDLTMTHVVKTHHSTINRTLMRQEHSTSSTTSQ